MQGNRLEYGLKLKFWLRAVKDSTVSNVTLCSIDAIYFSWYLIQNRPSWYYFQMYPSNTTRTTVWIWIFIDKRRNQERYTAKESLTTFKRWMRWCGCSRVITSEVLFRALLKSRFLERFSAWYTYVIQGNQYLTRNYVEQVQLIGRRLEILTRKILLRTLFTR